MREVLHIIAKLEEAGGRLELNGNRIRYAVPAGSPEAYGLLEQLRKHREAVRQLLHERETEQGPWPVVNRVSELRFVQPHAKLFPFLGRKVRTPAGTGTLIQAFADRCAVVLDAQVSECARFRPDEIEPVSWEVSE